jgi:hypothetical protein
MSNDQDVGLHLKTLGYIAHLIKNTDVVDHMKEIPAPGPQEVYNLLAENAKRVEMKRCLLIL